MSLRRLHHEQPETFEFTPANLEWAKAQIAKYPAGRQASAVIPLLWRAQEQEGWLSKPAIEYVAAMLDMAAIRALEVATFYFMFQLQPVGRVAHVQVCGTTSCMLCGAEDLIGVCREKIAPQPHQISADGKLSWEEVECLGACSNAPMVQIGKDYYEDLTAESFAELLDAFARGEVPTPGPQQGRFASEPAGGLTSLKGERHHDVNASLALARDLDDTIARITGEHPAPSEPARDSRPQTPPPPSAEPDGKARYVKNPDADAMADQPDIGGGESDVPVEGTAATAETETDGEAAPAREEPSLPEGEPMPRLEPTGVAEEAPAGAGPGGGKVEAGSPPRLLDAPEGEADDLRKIKGIGPKIEADLNDTGIWHYHQIAEWGDAEIAWLETRLGWHGRVGRDDWVGQARALANKD